jgi:hypothetical protein
MPPELLTNIFGRVPVDFEDMNRGRQGLARVCTAFLRALAPCKAQRNVKQ